MPEARGLAPNRPGKIKSLNPYAVVTVCGRRESTVIQRQTTDCLWDTTYVFKDLMLTKDEFERENVYVQVFNANTFTRNSLIGQYSFGLARVHRTKRDAYDISMHNHQIYRKWVVISDPKKPQLSQGFVRLTVMVLRPGDQPPSHNTDYEEKFAEPGSKGFQPLMPPRVKRRGYLLTMKAYRGEALPQMDFVSGKSDPFIVIKFNGVTVRTKVAKDTTNPVWNQVPPGCRRHAQRAAALVAGISRGGGGGRLATARRRGGRPQRHALPLQPQPG